MEYKISVIVPAYKSEATLPGTIDCLLGQSLHNEVQIILVNDGSPDRCPEIMKDYAAKHGNILFIDKENGGVSSARNMGIEKAEGKYILFLDSDDMDSPETCEALYDKMEKTGADCALFRVMRFGFGGNEFNPVVDEICRRDSIDPYDRCLLWSYLTGNKCYRTSLLKDSGIRFPDTRYAEDGAFFMSFLMKAHPKVTGVYGAVHKYRRTDPKVYKTVTQTMTPALCENFFRSTEIIYSAIKESFEKEDCPCEDKEGYLQEFYLKTCHTILNEFYRRLWTAGEDSLGILKAGFEKYYAPLEDEGRKKLSALDGDLGMPDWSRQSVAQSPFISVKVKNPTEDFVASIYCQTMPRFEILTENAGEYEGRENINHGKAKSGFVVSFSGKKSPDPRILRAILTLKKKFGFLPPAILRAGAETYLKIKDSRQK